MNGPLHRDLRGSGCLPIPDISMYCNEPPLRAISGREHDNKTTLGPIPRRPVPTTAEEVLSGCVLRANETQVADDLIPAALVGWVVDSINHRYVFEIERTDALEAGDTNAVLIRIRAAAMMGVDAAPRAEIVLRRAGIETIDRQRILARVDGDAADVG
jgi:hypothetical protein